MSDLHANQCPRKARLHLLRWSSSRAGPAASQRAKGSEVQAPPDVLWVGAAQSRHLAVKQHNVSSYQLLWKTASARQMSLAPLAKQLERLLHLFASKKRI